MNERDVLLNKLAQELRPMSEGIAWFDSLGHEELSEVLLFLRHRCVQARAVAGDAPESIGRAGLRPMHTPAALMSPGRTDEQLGKIAGLAPLDERRKAFRPLIAVLTIADARRRERFCSSGCNHGWHRGLAENSVAAGQRLARRSLRNACSSFRER
ncbi:DUF5958 family protein [Streptomyces sp. NPDC050549]|uniref:DUF5958 family protein n=1 Tax=Streptomyces sp. NPDC050549 TaxID=3155406 RepID=UPI00342E6579